MYTKARRALGAPAVCSWTKHEDRCGAASEDPRGGSEGVFHGLFATRIRGPLPRTPCRLRRLADSLVAARVLMLAFRPRTSASPRWMRPRLPIGRRAALVLAQAVPTKRSKSRSLPWDARFPRALSARDLRPSICHYLARARNVHSLGKGGFPSPRNPSRGVQKQKGGVNQGPKRRRGAR